MGIMGSLERTSGSTLESRAIKNGRGLDEQWLLETGEGGERKNFEETALLKRDKIDDDKLVKELNEAMKKINVFSEFVVTPQSLEDYVKEIKSLKASIKEYQQKIDDLTLEFEKEKMASLDDKNSMLDFGNGKLKLESDINELKIILKLYKRAYDRTFNNFSSEIIKRHKEILDKIPEQFKKNISIESESLEKYQIQLYKVLINEVQQKVDNLMFKFEKGEISEEEKRELGYMKYLLCIYMDKIKQISCNCSEVEDENYNNQEKSHKSL